MNDILFLIFLFFKFYFSNYKNSPSVTSKDSIHRSEDFIPLLEKIVPGFCK